MKPKILLSILAFGFISVFGQKLSLELTFTAINSASLNQYVQLDSIKVINQTQGGDTVLYWPDTVLVMGDPVEITEIIKEEDGLKVFQNYPNPVKDRTTITVYVPEKDKVGVVISDILGREVIHTDMALERGYQSFSFAPGSGEVFFFTAFLETTSSSIKILHTASNEKRTGSLTYIGMEIAEPKLKVTKAIQNFPCALGDEMLYIGYKDTLQSGIVDALETSETYTFQFATNIPCPGIPTITDPRDGQVYPTVQIGSQCWLQKNMNYQTGNSCCYDNNSTNCDTYGRLYDWETALGVCPSGWHLPSDEEWKTLEGTVDSQYGVGNSVWNQTGDRGFDAGKHLKSTTGWYSNGNGDNSSGFTALPGGGLHALGFFNGLTVDALFWSSSESYSAGAWYRILSCHRDDVYRGSHNKAHGRSARCLQD